MLKIQKFKHVFDFWKKKIIINWYKKVCILGTCATCKNFTVVSKNLGNS